MCVFIAEDKGSIAWEALPCLPHCLTCSYLWCSVESLLSETQKLHCRLAHKEQLTCSFRYTARCKNNGKYSEIFVLGCTLLVQVCTEWS
jgi:hypothetical protein